MGLIVAKESAYATEMRKWEAQHSEFGPPGRPYQFQPFPAMFYLIAHGADLSPEIVDKQIADDENAANNLRSRGFGSGLAEAMELFTKRNTEIATLAANRAHGDQRMSEQAQREAATVDAETLDHVPVIPETPIKRRGRKPKTQTE